MKIIIFPRYDHSQAATRMRVVQYLPYLKEVGICVEVFPILRSSGISGRSGIFLFIGSRLKSYYRVGKKLFKERGTESIIHIHSELFPFVPFWLEYGYLSLLGKRKFIIELDDAWFHRYDAHKSQIIKLLLGAKINLLMKHSTLLIAGNKYIADRGRLAGAKYIEIIPTVVDVERYKNYKVTNNDKNFSKDKLLVSYNSELEEVTKRKPVIGWIGSPATTKFLLTISDVIISLTNNDVASFVAFGADPYQIRMLPVRVVSWSEQIELETLHKFDIGIMPLIDSPFERGKCGYKIIQYMAIGLPVVASPVGVNESIVVHNVTGYLAKTNDDWHKYLSVLCNDSGLREEMGQEGLLRVDKLYSLRVTSSQFVSAMKNVLEN